MGTYIKELKRIELEPNIFKIESGVFDSGSCQCFKDCDCYRNKGKQLYTENSFIHLLLVIQHNDKPRRFKTLEALKDSYKHFVNKNNLLK